MNIYAGNLSQELTEDELREAFAAFGEVASVVIIKDRFTGVPRGFGFIEMPSKEEAEAAINGLNGQELKGNTIKVNEAYSRDDRRRRGGDFRGGRGDLRGPGGGGRY